MAIFGPRTCLTVTILLLFCLSGPSIKAGESTASVGRWASVDMERLFFLGCVLYGYSPGTSYLLDDLAALKKHDQKLEQFALEITTLQRRKAAFLGEHKAIVQKLMDSRPENFERELTRLDRWLDGKVATILEKLGPLRKEARRLESHTRERKAGSIANRNKAIDTIGSAIRHFIFEAMSDASTAVVMNVSSFTHGRKPTPEETSALRVLMRTPLKVPIGLETPTGATDFSRWWSLRHALYLEPFGRRLPIPFLVVGGIDISPAVAGKLMEGAAKYQERDGVKPMWQIVQRPTGTAVPGAVSKPSAKSQEVIATVDLDMLLLFHPSMANFIPAYGRFIRPINTYFLKRQRQAEMEKRLARSDQLRQEAETLERRFKKDIDRANIRLREAKRKLYDGRMAAQLERDRIIANVPRAKVIDMTGQDKGYVEKPLDDENLPASLVERKIIGEKHYWRTVKELEDNYRDIEKGAETEIKKKQDRIKLAYENVRTVMFLSEEETRDNFREMLTEIRSVTGQIATTNGLSVVINRTYRGSRLYEDKSSPALLEPADTPDKLSIPEKSALAQLMDIRQKLLDEAAKLDTGRKYVPPVENEVGFLADSQLEEWFFTRKELAKTRNKYINSPMFLTGSVDITLNVLEKLLRDHQVDDTIISKIMEFCTTTLSTDD